MAGDDTVCRDGPAEALFHEGLAHVRARQYASAADSFQRCLQIAPDRVSVLTNLAAVLTRLDRHDEAQALCAKAIGLDARAAAAWMNLGLIERERANHAAAVERFEAALRIRPSYAEAWSNKGAALSDLNRCEEALDCFERALAIDPQCTEAWYNQGVALEAMHRSAEAVRSYEAALRISPTYVEAWNNRAIALERLGQLDEAVASYEKALALDPQLDFLDGALLHAQMRLCDWRELPQRLSTLLDRVRAGARVSPPFALLALADAPDLALAVARTWVGVKCPPVPQALAAQGAAPLRGAREDGRIRLAYFSADFHAHATAHLMAELFELHDRSRFELMAFSYGPEAKDLMRERLVASFDRFIDVSALPDGRVAALARELGVDIAVDLKGFTQDSRAAIFAHRAAPIQVSYLGYPGTMGAEFIDYIVADRIVIPDPHRRFYSEKVVYLPGSYQINDRKRRIAPQVFERSELGLPADSFVFCCFNNSFKITPDTFDGWMRVLRRAEAGVLWLLQDHPAAAANLRREAKLRGVDPSRLVFAQRMEPPQHLARHRAADLFLDTLPYNAHTTASDALRAGLPVLTRIGNAFAGRVAASLLAAVGLPELIAETADQFEDLAVELATKPEKLQRLRQKLAEIGPGAPLFDAPALARNLEDAYQQMHTRYLSGQPPEDFAVH